MGLEWSEHYPPDGKISYYDHVIAVTPLGAVRLEWKSWKDYDSPCGEMPWGEFVSGRTLDAAKAAAQAAWNRMAAQVAELKTD